MDALTALPSSGPAPVLVVDQCEEVVTLCDDPAERAAFFAALAAHAERGPLVIALRADRLGDLSAHPDFARLVEPGLHLLSAMSEADLRAAIEGPARQAGLLLGAGPGRPAGTGGRGRARRAARCCRTRCARRGSGARAARSPSPATSAPAASAVRSPSRPRTSTHRVPDEQRPLLRDLLLRLVTPTPEGEPVRSRVPRRTVATDAEHEQLIELLVGARLVTSDDDTVELAHESLARAWPRLRSWLDDDVEGQRILRHLALTADAWDGMGRPDSELYRGVRLAQALEWQTEPTPTSPRPSGPSSTPAPNGNGPRPRAAEQRLRQQARQNRRLRAPARRCRRAARRRPGRRPARRATGRSG